MNARGAGFTLYELLIVVALIAIIGAAALPSLSGTSNLKLETTAREIADGLRFARGEAMRTGVPHGARLDQSPPRLRVFKLTTPPTEEFTVYHPHDSQLYDLDFDSNPQTQGVQIAASAFFAVAFTKDGVPCSPTDLSWLATGAINLAANGSSAAILIESRTGRVSIQ
jgi:prepilin-type N-terminal cleavage/methylation domain-containing protein